MWHERSVYRSLFYLSTILAIFFPIFLPGEETLDIIAYRPGLTLRGTAPTKMADDIILTPAGKKKLDEELETLKSVEMPALSERIREARALGDLSENFDYQDAKRQQGFIAGRIADLNAMLERATIVEATVGGDIVGMGTTVNLRDLDFEDELSYTIVDPISADPTNDKISISSPVGQALMGKKVGEIVEVKTPGGVSRLEVLSLA